MKKLVIKTDMDIMKKILGDAGFEVDGNKVVVPEGKENSYVDYLDKAIGYSNELENSTQAVVDNSDQVNFRDIYNDGVIEDDVTDTKEDSMELNGPKLSKKLGEMPTNNHGLSNSLGLSFYLVIDILAIVVGVYLLMH